MADTFIFTNDAVTTLTSAMAADTLLMQVASGATFPFPTTGEQFSLWMTDAATGLNHEIIYVTANASNQFTCLRAQEGTSAQSWAIGDQASHNVTAAYFNGLSQGGTLLRKPQVFTSSGSYTPPTTLGFAIIEGVGGGGGGGGSTATGASAASAAGGGGAGSYAMGYFSAATIAAALTSGVLPITIGAGGAGGSIGGGGNNGGTTSAGSLMTMPGGDGAGTGGTTTTSGFWPGGLNSSAPSGGNMLASDGGSGAGGLVVTVASGANAPIVPGAGANSQFGAGGVAAQPDTAGQPGGVGAGGSGASSGPSFGGAVGGQGGNGYLRIWEYSAT